MVKIKKNKFLILYILIIVLIVILSFVEYFKVNFNYVNRYNEIKNDCYYQENASNELCSNFSDTTQLQNFIDEYNPQKHFKSIDAISLTCSIVENTTYSILQFLSPLLIGISIVGTLHTEYSSGMFKNYLLRMNYKKYLKEKYKIVIKTATIIPISLILIFVLSCVITKFNFNVSESMKITSVYHEWRHSNFLLYGTMICLLQFLMSLFYGNLNLSCCKESRNKIVSIIMGYLCSLACSLFIYIIIYSLFINKIFGLENLTDVFLITGYWFFSESNYVLPSLIVALILVITSFVLIYNKYKNKEGVINANEKQTV